MTIWEAVVFAIQQLFAASAGGALGFAVGVLVRNAKKRDAVHPVAAELPAVADEETDRIARQIENIMNYDGTERGQKSLEK